jgi:hypothetical protein
MGKNELFMVMVYLYIALGIVCMSIIVSMIRTHIWFKIETRKIKHHK